MKKITLFFTILLLTALSYTAKAAESRTVVCTAGNLASVAASYLTTVTNLTVTGTIDARDFKTMRDDMPLLEVIDLSGTTVAAYSGTLGTEGTTSISYPANGIPAYAFYNSSTYIMKTSLKTFSFPAFLTTIGEGAFNGCSGLIGSLTLPSSLTTIGDWSLSGCRGFTGSLVIPSTVTTIGNGAFGFCTGFTGYLTIPSSVTTISSFAFVGCSGFIEVDAANPNYSSADGVLFNKDKTTLIQCPISKIGNYIIPSTVTTIGIWAFGYCTGFTGTLTIPSSVTTIGESAFRICGCLFEVDLANPNYSSLDGILYNKNKTVLMNCPTSKSGTLIVPSTVTTIGGDAFSGCTGFTGMLTIPSTVTTIRSGAFSDCTGLTSIYAYATTPIDISASSYVFSGVNKSIPLHVPVGSKSLYAAANQWKDFTNIVEGFPTSLNDISSNSISIYPNPATSTITVSELGSPNTGNTVSLSVVDVTGTTVLVKEVEANINSLSIDVSSLKKGIYFITLQTNNGKVVKRFVKE